MWSVISSRFLKEYWRCRKIAKKFLKKKMPNRIDYKKKKNRISTFGSIDGYV